jgi:hypothetical protein
MPYRLSPFASCLAAGLTLALSGCISRQDWKKIPTVELEGWKHTDNLGPWQSTLVVERVAKNPDGSFTALNYEGTASFMGYGIRDEIKAVKITPKEPAPKK